MARRTIFDLCAVVALGAFLLVLSFLVALLYISGDGSDVRARFGILRRSSPPRSPSGSDESGAFGDVVAGAHGGGIGGAEEEEPPPLLPQHQHQQPNTTTSSPASAKSESSYGGGGDGVKFVFFVGIEGTGHHFMTSLLKQSPAVQLHKKLQLQGDIKSLSRSLYVGMPALLNLHCAGNTNKVNVTPTRMKVVNLFRDVADKVGNATNATTAIPLNAAGYVGEMSSYPQDQGECRPVRYPNLGILYAVCREAQVECQHIYLYRDPYSVIKSTTIHRHFFKHGILEAIHEYITMLYVILGELTMFPYKTAGCFGMEDAATAITKANEGGKNNKNTNNANINIAATEKKNLFEEQWGPIRDMFGWKDQPGQFHKYVTNHYRAPTPPPDSLIQAIDNKYKSYMNSMVHISNSVADLCKKQQRQQH